jgi:PhnB protein
VVTTGVTSRQNGTTVTDRTFFQSLRADSLDELTGYWDALADGDSIVEPLAASAWSPGFGMLTDRFGVTWVLDVRAAYAG